VVEGCDLISRDSSSPVAIQPFVVCLIPSQFGQEMGLHCYNTPCNIAASDCFCPSERSCSCLIPSTGTSPCCQPSHHETAPSSHPHHTHLSFSECPRSHPSGSPWINSVHLSLVISGHLCCLSLDCLCSAWLTHPRPLPNTSRHSSRTSSAC
jgi:hypothetical protein